MQIGPLSFFSSTEILVHIDIDAGTDKTWDVGLVSQPDKDN